MSDDLNRAYDAIDEAHAKEPAATRRQVLATTGGVLGGMGLLGLAPSIANARHDVDNGELLNAAATAEALATIVNTVGYEKRGELNFSDLESRNIQGAAREELIHYEFLTSSAVGARPLTKRIWVPDAVFADHDSFFKAIFAGDQVFINAYLIAVTSFGNDGNGKIARFAAETMGAEAMHLAAASVALGGAASFRAFMRYSQPEEDRRSPRFGEPGARTVDGIVGILQGLGFGFGQEGATPGRFYDYDEVSRRTPNPDFVNTRSVR